MSLQTELKNIEANPALLTIYADKRCRNKCYGRGTLRFVIGKDAVTGEDKVEERTCPCVIKSLKRDMKRASDG